MRAGPSEIFAFPTGEWTLQIHWLFERMHIFLFPALIEGYGKLPLLCIWRGVLSSQAEQWLTIWTSTAPEINTWLSKNSMCRRSSPFPQGKKQRYFSCMKPLSLSGFLMNKTLTEISRVFLVIWYSAKTVLGMVILIQQVWNVVVNNYLYGAISYVLT